MIVALPGPPREMIGMWEAEVEPRLRLRGLGEERVTRTYRLTGIGESAVAALLGERLLRAKNPVVATYARTDAVDVRITAVAQDGRSPADLVDAAAGKVLAKVGRHVWGQGADTWPEAIGRELARLGWRVALVEIDTGGTAARLLGEARWLAGAWLASGLASSTTLADVAEAARRDAGVDVGVAVQAVESDDCRAGRRRAVRPRGRPADGVPGWFGRPSPRGRCHGRVLVRHCQRGGTVERLSTAISAGRQCERHARRRTEEQVMSTTEKVSGADLAQLPLFAGIAPADLESLAAESNRRRLDDGDTLAEMGSPISEVHWLERGQLGLRVRSEQRWVLVSTLHPGDLLGWSALREEPTALSTARAIGPAVLVSMPANGLMKLLTGGTAQSEALLRRLFGFATQHLDESRAQVLQLGREGVISAG